MPTMGLLLFMACVAGCEQGLDGGYEGTVETACHRDGATGGGGAQTHVFTGPVQITADGDWYEVRFEDCALSARALREDSLQISTSRCRAPGAPEMAYDGVLQAGSMLSGVLTGTLVDDDATTTCDLTFTGQRR